MIGIFTKCFLVCAILDSYKYVYLSQNFGLFWLLLQPSCFGHWVAAKQVSYYTYFWVRIHVCLLWHFYFWSRGEFCEQTSNKRRSSLAEASWNNQWNRQARLPRPPGSKLVPGRLSITSKIFVQEDSNLRNPASCWFRAWLCQPASPDYPQIRSFRLYTNRHKILKRSNTGSTTFSSTT